MVNNLAINGVFALKNAVAREDAKVLMTILRKAQINTINIMVLRPSVTTFDKVDSDPQKLITSTGRGFLCWRWSAQSSYVYTDGKLPAIIIFDLHNDTLIGWEDLRRSFRVTALYLESFGDQQSTRSHSLEALWQEVHWPHFRNLSTWTVHSRLRYASWWISHLIYHQWRLGWQSWISPPLIWIMDGWEILLKIPGTERLGCFRWIHVWKGSPGSVREQRMESHTCLSTDHNESSSLQLLRIINRFRSKFSNAVATS